MCCTEILCEVQSWICSGITSRHHQLPRLPLLRKHLHRQRLQKEVSLLRFIPKSVFILAFFAPVVVKKKKKYLIPLPKAYRICFPSFTTSSPCGEQKANVGLNLKFNKKNEEVPGYTKRTEKEWLYSAAVEELLAEYLDRYMERQGVDSFSVERLKVLNDVFFIDFPRCSTQCPETVMMMFSMRMTSGLERTKMGKIHTMVSHHISNDS